MKDPSAWALIDPDGEIVSETIVPTTKEAWEKAYQYLSQQEGKEWRAKFWKRLMPMQGWMRKQGWRISKVRLELW